jgi:topoisomerase IV subunit A
MRISCRPRAATANRCPARVDPPDGATFAAVLIGEPDDLWLLASDAGYGFKVKLARTVCAQQEGQVGAQGAGECAGAAGAADLAPDAFAMFVNNDGEVLALPVAQIEEMSAGKGQNLYGIPGKKSAERDEYLVAMAVVAPGEQCSRSTAATARR